MSMESVISTAKTSIATASTRESGIPERLSISVDVSRCGALDFGNVLNKGMMKMNMTKKVIQRAFTKSTVNNIGNKITVAIPPVINPVATTKTHGIVYGK